jgi:hypothetical protein
MNRCYSLDDVDCFIARQLGAKGSSSDADLFVERGLSGDDCAQFIGRFAAAFAVDLSGYLWYFHEREEPYAAAFLQIFFPAPQQRVTHIPVTAELLLAAANAGEWTVDYPPHSVSGPRYDVIAAYVLITLLIYLIGAVALVAWLG